MGIEVNGRVGPGFAQDGSLADPRMTKDLGTVIQELHGKYYEATYRGNVFTCSTSAAGTTLVAANLSPLAAGGTPIIGLYNPQSSGKNLVINKVNVAVVTLTASTGNIVWNYALNQTITAATNGVITSNFLGGSAASVVKAYVNTATTGSTAAIMLRPAFQVQEVSAVGDIFGLAEQDINGDIIVPPGALIALANGISNTTTVLSASITWEEALI
jgi:hypothetical protein